MDAGGGVRLAIAIRSPGAEPARHPVEGPVTVGGSRADGIPVPSLPPAALRLVPADGGLVVEPSAPGVRVAGRLVPPGARRLLRRGERLSLRGVALALEADDAPPPDASTRCAAAALLRDAAGGAPPALARLVVITGPRAGALLALGADQSLGRGRRAAIRLPDARASRLHARLRVDGGGATVEDLGSRNGVRVNGVRVEPGRPVPLAPGDELVLGDTALALEDAAGLFAAARAGPAAGQRGGLRMAAAALLAAAALALALAAA